MVQITLRHCTCSQCFLKWGGRFNAYKTFYLYDSSNGHVMMKIHENTVLDVLCICNDDYEPKVEKKSQTFNFMCACICLKGRLINCMCLTSNNSSYISPVVYVHTTGLRPISTLNALPIDSSRFCSINTSNR